MISNSIVILSMVFAIAFGLAWLRRRELREQIERPKYRFQDQVRQFDQHCQNLHGEENKAHVRD